MVDFPVFHKYSTIMSQNNMAESTVSGASSSVDGQSYQSRVKRLPYEERNIVTFPIGWRHHLTERYGSAEKFKKSLKYFYQVFNGMQLMFEDICRRLIIPTPIPEHLSVDNIDDKEHDKRAFERGQNVPFTDEQAEGLKNEEVDTIQGLLAIAMTDCKNKKLEAITKCDEICKMTERFDERLVKHDLRDKRLSPCEPLHMFEAEKEVQQYLQILDNDKLQRCIEYLYVNGRIQEKERSEEREDYERKLKIKDESMLQRINELEKKHSAELRESEEKRNILDKTCMEISKRNNENSIDKQKIQKELDKNKVETSEKIKQTEKQLKDEKARASNSEKKMKATEKEMQTMQRELKEFAQINVTIQRDRADQSVKISRLEENSQQLVIQNSNLKSSIKDLESKLTHQTQLNVDKENMMRQMKYELQRKDREIADLKANKETLLTRLSKVAGAKLTHDNANITDLSDPNRPTKIAEKFSELYDNEWTDALEELVAANVNETSSILFLRDSLMKSFRLCSETARKQTIESRRCFEELPTPDSEDLKICSAFSDHKLSLDTTVKKEIDRIRKELAPSTANLVQKRFKVILEEHLKIFLESQATITEAVQESIQEEPFQTEKQSSPESKSTMQLPLPVSAKLGSLSRSFSSPSSEEPKPGVNLSKSMYSKLPPPEIMMVADLADFNKGIYIKKENDADDKKVSQNVKEESKKEGEVHDQEEWVNVQGDDTQKEKVVGHDQTATDSNLLCSSDQNDVLPEEQRIEQNNPASDLQLKNENPEGFEIIQEGKQSDLVMHNSRVHHARDINDKDQESGKTTASDGQAGEDNSKINDEAPAKQDLTKELAKQDLLTPNGQTGEDNSKINDEAPAKQDLPKELAKQDLLTLDGQTGEDNSKINDEALAKQDLSKELAKQDLLTPDGQTGEDNSKIKDEASAKQDLPKPDQTNTPSTQSFEIRFQKLFNYSRKCVSLCWFMRSHSPELYLEDKAVRDSKLDTEHFKQYTKTGHTVDYVVWPALFLHEGGPLLGKGVAQPK